jgi:hypothetical protein
MAHVGPITRLALALVLAALAPAALTAAPREAQPRLDPRQLSALPSYVQRVEAAIVGLQVEVPREVQKMFHAMYGDTHTHHFHNYADTFEASFEKAKSMVQQMAFDYEAFLRTGTVGNAGRA